MKTRLPPLPTRSSRFLRLTHRGGAQAFGYLVIYTSFGVLKGRTGMTFHDELLSQEKGGDPPQLIELNDVIVEHYSNHLATANFERFYVRLSEVQAFALVGSKGQS